jgi:hypothetical protein
MTLNPPASHHPARWRATATALALATTALALATLPALAASAAPAAALSGGPTVHEQQALSQAIPIAAGNVHTTITTTPGLAAHNYLVNLAIGVGNIAPGAKVLCGFGPTGPGDTGTSNYGEVDNFGTTAATGGNCVATGTVTLTTSNDHIFAWATVYSGPGGATVGDYSMNEQPVGTVVITH